MLDLLKSYEGPTKTDDISAGWNTLFMTVSVFFSSVKELGYIYRVCQLFASSKETSLKVVIITDLGQRQNSA